MFSSGFQSKARETCAASIFEDSQWKQDLTVSNKCLYALHLLPALCITLEIPDWGDN